MNMATKCTSRGVENYFFNSCQLLNFRSILTRAILQLLVKKSITSVWAIYLELEVLRESPSPYFKSLLNLYAELNLFSVLVSTLVAKNWCAFQDCICSKVWTCFLRSGSRSGILKEWHNTKVKSQGWFCSGVTWMLS